MGFSFFVYTHTNVPHPVLTSFVNNYSAQAKDRGTSNEMGLVMVCRFCSLNADCFGVQYDNFIINLSIKNTLIPAGKP